MNALQWFLLAALIAVAAWLMGAGRLLGRGPRAGGCGCANSGTPACPMMQAQMQMQRAPEDLLTRM